MQTTVKSPEKKTRPFVHKLTLGKNRHKKIIYAKKAPFIRFNDHQGLHKRRKLQARKGPLFSVCALLPEDYTFKSWSAGICWCKKTSWYHIRKWRWFFFAFFARRSRYPCFFVVWLFLVRSQLLLFVYQPLVMLKLEKRRLTFFRIHLRSCLHYLFEIYFRKFLQMFGFLGILGNINWWPIGKN